MCLAAADDLVTAVILLYMACCWLMFSVATGRLSDVHAQAHGGHSA
jgi:hypothetical protein